MSFKPRCYQQKIIDGVIEKLKQGKRRILIVCPTGGGKTVITTSLTQRCIDKGKTTNFICHRRELIEQTFKTFTRNHMNPSFIAGGRRYRPGCNVQISSINTLVNRIDKVYQPDVCFWDECHHQAASQWEKVFKEFGSSVHIGLTATPVRLDGKSLGDFYDAMVLGPSARWLMDEGFLVEYKYFAPSQTDRSKLKFNSKGEATEESLEKANFTTSIIGDNVQYYKKHAMGKRNVVFARNVKHSMAIVKRYNESGIPAKHLDGNTPVGERSQALKDFADGKILVLSNVDLFGEGFDLPSIEVVSILTVSNSLSRVLQIWGRGLRPVYEPGYDLETKEGRLTAIAESYKPFAMIFDHGNNYEIHGLPDDERNWSLDSGVKVKKKSKSDDSIALKTCINCFEIHRPALECPHCGYKYIADGKVIKEVEGELYMVNSTEFKEAMRKQIRVVKSYEDLVKIESEMKYKNGWAENQWKGKTGEDLKSTLAGLQKIATARGYARGWAYNRYKITQRRR